MGWRPPCGITRADTLSPGIAVLRPVSVPQGAFAAEPDSAERFGDEVLTGLGPDAEAAGAWGAFRLLRSPRIVIDARGLAPGTTAAFAAGALLRAWRFDSLKTGMAPDAPGDHAASDDATRLADIGLLTDDAGWQAWMSVLPGVTGALFARDLVSEPANLLTPSGFVERLDFLRGFGVSVEILPAHGFGGLQAVGGGSCHPPCLAVLRWAGAGAGAPVAFVGKGITFDTGGISIKPADRMWEMRADMAGAAACAGAMLALAMRRSPAAAMAVLAIAENSVGSASYRPGDVLRMGNGMTVAVVDTDAEGRLVLADALAYAARQSPSAIVDLATLTGSIVTALGHHLAGAFTTDEPLLRAARAAGEAVGERVWHMPVTDGYLRSLDSNIADIAHCVDGSGQPDACQAAAFLREFVGQTPWLHLDIAGVEEQSERTERHAKGATGWGVRLLDRLVATHFEGADG